MNKSNLIVLTVLLYVFPPLGALYLFYLLFIYNPEGSSIPTLKLVNYETPNTDVIVSMTGEYKGIKARIARWLGLAQSSSLSITKEEVRVSISDASGVQYFVAPLRDVKATDLRLEKPIASLWIGLILIIGMILVNTILNGLVSSLMRMGSSSYYGGGSFEMGFLFWIGIIIGACFIAHYYFSNRIVVAVTTNNLSERYGIAFEVGGKLTIQQVFTSFIQVHHYLNIAHQAEIGA